MMKQNFLGLIIETLEGKESLYINTKLNNYGWFYSYEKYGVEIHRAEGIVESSFFANATKVLSNFKVQPYLKFGSSGLDGISYTLIMGDSIVESRFRWHNSLPEEWAVFIPILDDLYQNLQIARKEITLQK